MDRRFLASKPKWRVSKWRLLFTVFIVIYFIVLVFNLDSMTIQWDEANHLNGALLLAHGRIQLYATTSLFYPPLDDLLIAGFFAITGPSVLAGRLIGVIFAVLSVWVLFEFTQRTYEPKTAFLSSVLLATMPGFVWLARLAMLETMLVFFFSVSMMLFFFWLQKHHIKFLTLSAVALGLGFLTKYQIIIAVPAMLTSIFLLSKSYLKEKLSRFPLLILIVICIILPWVLFSFQAYTSGMLDQWLYAMGAGNPQKSLYSARFPAPLFYLIEMTWPYGAVHPVSLFVYVLGLLGLLVLATRRTAADKFLLVWFFAMYIFFTVIGNRQWRYIVPVFPVLALSASTLIISAYNKLQKTWKTRNPASHRVGARKIAAVFLVAAVGFSVAYSCVDAYNWVAKDSAFHLPLEQAATYALSNLDADGSLMVLCPINVFSADILKFYVYASPRRFTYVGDYPALPVDAYPPDFNVTELVDQCIQHDVQYLLLYEYGQEYPYYNSNLTMSQVYSMLMASQKFTLQTSFGTYPNRIYVLSFS
jgi:hypothetical protein